MTDKTTPQDDAAMSPASTGSLAWIPAGERLPERNEIVLVIDQGGGNVGSYSPMLDDWWTLHGDRMAPSAIVSHWMPLPAPPTDAK